MRRRVMPRRSLTVISLIPTKMLITNPVAPRARARTITSPVRRRQVTRARTIVGRDRYLVGRLWDRTPSKWDGSSKSGTDETNGGIKNAVRGMNRFCVKVKG